jgi:hypothetical protein
MTSRQAVRPALAFGAIVAGMVAGMVAAGPLAGAWAAQAVQLAPHRAVYDLKLARTRGTRGIEGIRGRILYDFSGSSCAGYELQFRQVSELSSGEGKTALSDLNSKTWEDAAAKIFRFNSENRLNTRAVDVVDGNAERRQDAVAVKLTKPNSKTLSLPHDVVFPTEHMRRIIEAARDGKSILELKVYDGSETGEKLYNTLTVIGRKIAPGQQPPQDAAVRVPSLAALARWPTTISYFEIGGKRDASGEQTPVYALSFELYENGISRALVLDYTDFVINGEMTSLEMKTAKPCK